MGEEGTRAWEQFHGFVDVEGCFVARRAMYTPKTMTEVGWAHGTRMHEEAQ